MPQPRSYEVIVVGLGAMGCATLFHLARRGVRVLGVEQFAPGHAFGSSHGDSRIIRETYFEHPLYVPLVQRAHQLWRELQSESGATLMTITGGLMIGRDGGMVVSGTLRSAREHGLPHEVLSPQEVEKRYPAFRIAADVVVVLDPRAGYLDPEACNTAHLGRAARAGAETQFENQVIEWSPAGEGVRVETHSGTYFADRLVLAAGAWNPRLTGDLKLPLAIERQTVFWFEPGEAAAYDRAEFPIYAYEFKPGTICYGFPRLPRGVKASVMHDGIVVHDVKSVNRQIRPKEVEPLRDALRPVLPALSQSPVRESGVCLFTNAPDHDFVIDFHPRYPQVLISSPCSGHGFKFASAIGELQADLLTEGRSRFDLSPFRIGRFSSL